MKNSKQSLLLVTILLLAASAASVGGCTQLPASETTTTMVSALYPAPILGVVIDNDRMVVDIIPNSAADKAGVQRGDVILKVNDITITDRKQPRSMVLEIGRNRPVDDPATLKLVLQRGGREIVMQVRLEIPPQRPSATKVPRTRIPDDKTFF